MGSRLRTWSVEDLEDWMEEHLFAKGRMSVAQKEELVISPKESNDQKGLEGTSFVTSQAELSQPTYLPIMLDTDLAVAPLSLAWPRILAL